MPWAKKYTDDEPSTLTPTVIEMMRATAEVRGAKVTARAKKSKGDERSTLTPTVIETMHAMSEVKDTKAMPRARSPKKTSQALSRRR